MTNRVRITSRSPGFRRAGIAHPAGPVEHPADTFTPRQLVQLLDERELVVELLMDGEPLSGDKVAQFREGLEHFLSGETPGGGNTDSKGAAPAASAPAVAQPDSRAAEGQAQLGSGQDPNAPAGGVEGTGPAGATPEADPAKAGAADGAAPAGTAEAPKPKPAQGKSKGKS